MLKLMKYEFRKQAWSKGILLFLAAVVEIVFLYGIIVSKEDIQMTGLGLLSMLTFGGLFYVGIECIDTFSKDLKTKCSYMLFMTPNTSYSIVGAKMLSAGIQVLVTGFAFLGIYILNGTILITKYNQWAELKRMIEEFSREMLHMDLDMDKIMLVLLSLLVSWICFIAVAFLSITLSTTFLADKKWKGFVSIVIFVALFWIFGKITNMVINYIDLSNADVNKQLIWNCLLTFAFTVAAYFGTSWMLDKKVSL